MRATADDSSDFGIEHRRNVFQPIFGDGIFTQEGLKWKSSRSTIRRQLQHKQYSNLNSFKATVDNLVHILRESSGIIDLQPLFFRMTLDITTEFVFGESVQSLVAPDGSIKRRFADAFDIVQRRATRRMRSFDLRWLGDHQQYSQAWDDLTQITDHMLDQNIEASKADRNSSSRHDFLRAIARDTGDRPALRGQVLNLLAAGRDTTASLLSWTM